jgi:hypothetical protein
MTGFFSEESLAQVEAMFAEGQENPYEGKCGQKKLREQAKQPRTPAQEEADRARSQAGRGAPARGNRSEAAKKAAATRAKCKKGGAPAGPTT